MDYKKQIDRRTLIGYLCIVIGILVIAAVPRSHDKDDGLLFYISGYGEQIGQYPNKEEAAYFSLTLENQSNKTYKINTIEPVISDKIKWLLLDDQIIINEPKILRKKKEIEFKGQFKINTSKLSEEGVNELLPMIKEYKITYDDNKVITLKTGS